MPPGWPPDPALPVEGWTEVDLPLERLWAVFSDVRGWRQWNPCIWVTRVQDGELAVGSRLVWAFNAMRWWYPYKLPALARVVECEPARKVTWEVRLPGFHALHSYLFEPLGEARCRFGSWEVAEGPTYRTLRPFWLAHFRYVCRASLDGARAGAVPLASGVRLVAHGEATEEPTLVAIPGIDGSPGSIAPIVERLARRRQVVVADYSGEDNDTLEALAEEIGDAAETTVDGPFDVLGQSIGSILAARVAARHHQVRKVVLIGTFTRARWRALRVSNVLARRSPRLLYRLLSRPLMAIVCGPVGDGRRHPFLDAVQRSDPRAAARRTAWQVDRDFTPDLDALHHPTLVLMGGDDRFVPDVSAEVERLRSVLNDQPASLVVVPDAGHVLLPSAAVDTAVAKIEAFL